ncbi:MAG: LPS export ABC transporter periplasmic protein LptC [Phycisphaerae bacterium]|nr:LPS export ABC transporter periplasmic protein LptC [Phycisphaerae bacterium]MDD5381351.1 LPS export ABC transporter periplasmic protein LptC [Phycisphaerae bacterium]
MNLQSRKLRVWLISIGTIFVIFLFYNLISRTPPIEIDSGDTSADSNTVDFDGKVGRVGSVGVGTIQKAKYTHLNEKKQIDREFGFEKLLHAQGNEWEIEKPYMNVFQSNLKCYMTADKGTVQVEDAVGKATPKDATLTGNVVIHILPGKGSKIKEGFIYLDDIIFISEKSLFLSPGPIKLTSEDVQMRGKGLEIVYNEGLDRLEYLKIITLETLRIRQSSKASLFASETAAPESPVGVGSGAQAEQQKTKEIPATDGEKIEKKKSSYYKCVFRKNVVIDCPEQIVLADEVSIDNLQWSKSSDVNSENKTPGGTIAAEVPEESVTSPLNEPNKSPEQFADIVVTCDNGIIVIPMDVENTASESSGLKSFNDQKGRSTFVAQKIDYCVITDDTVASGPSELTFYANDVMGDKDSPRPSEKGGSKQPAVPVKITAQEKAAFLPVSNQVIFEGNVLCTMLRPLRPGAGKAKTKGIADLRQKYSLSSPKLTVDLSKSREASRQSRVDIKHITAKGEVVQLDTSKWAGEQLLGFTKLKCLQFDYDVEQQMFLATGSGIIAVDNAKIIEPVKETGRFSLQKPCYAVVRNFNTLKYLKEANIITADAGAEQILIDYFPVIKGQKGQQTTATANHIDAVLYETAAGQTELSTLNAKGGITYEEKKPKKGTTVQFVGSEMFYDGGKSMITAWGDELQPCFLNGALAPGIEYNLKTNKIKTKITGPGMLQMAR